MPLGDPQAVAYLAVRVVDFTHTATGFHTSATFEDLNGDTSSDDLDAAAQAFVDLMTSSKDFSQVAGVKQEPVSRDITPDA